MLEVPHQGASNECPQQMFSSRNKKNFYLGVSGTMHTRPIDPDGTFFRLKSIDIFLISP